MNHCIHGVELNSYCPECELAMLDFANWLEISPLYLESFKITDLLLSVN